MTQPAASQSVHGSPPDAPQRLGVAGRLAAAFQAHALTPLLAVVALLLGLFAVLITPREEEPQINVTMANVIVPFPGASSADVQAMVAKGAQLDVGRQGRRRARAHQDRHIGVRQQGLAQSFEPLRDVDRIADHRVVHPGRGADVADHDGTGMHADPQPDRLPGPRIVLA